MTHFSKKEARKIILLSQGLAGPKIRKGAKHQVLNLFDQLGYIQIDTISVIERAHHHKLWSRVDGYNKRILGQLESERQIFEYWSHAASYLPIKYYRYTLPVKQELANRNTVWFKKDPREMAYVLDRIKVEGPLMSRDFEAKPKRSNNGPVDWGPNKQSLFHLFMQGDLLIAKRDNFQKVYDLPERWLPEGLDVSMPTREEYLRFLILRDLKAHGLIKASEVGYLIKGIKKEVNELLNTMVEEGSVLACTVQGRSNDTYYHLPSIEELLNISGYKRRLRILSPFDNLIINRKRTLELFDFDYTLECFFPQSKRKFGYFGLPILWGDRLIGQIDLKADRAKKIMEVRNMELVKNFKGYDRISILFLRELLRISQFNGCESIKVSKDVPIKIY